MDAVRQYTSASRDAVTLGLFKHRKAGAARDFYLRQTQELPEPLRGRVHSALVSAQMPPDGSWLFVSPTVSQLAPSVQPLTESFYLIDNKFHCLQHADLDGSFPVGN